MITLTVLIILCFVGYKIIKWLFAKEPDLIITEEFAVIPANYKLYIRTRPFVFPEPRRGYSSGYIFCVKSNTNKEIYICEAIDCATWSLLDYKRTGYYRLYKAGSNEEIIARNIPTIYAKRR